MALPRAALTAAVHRAAQAKRRAVRASASSVRPAPVRPLPVSLALVPQGLILLATPRRALISRVRVTGMAGSTKLSVRLKRRVEVFGFTAYMRLQLRWAIRRGGCAGCC
jgi:hypothetical protein